MSKFRYIFQLRALTDTDNFNIAEKLMREKMYIRVQDPNKRTKFCLFLAKNTRSRDRFVPSYVTIYRYTWMCFYERVFNVGAFSNGALWRYISSCLVPSVHSYDTKAVVHYVFARVTDIICFFELLRVGDYDKCDLKISRDASSHNASSCNSIECWKYGETSLNLAINKIACKIYLWHVAFLSRVFFTGQQPFIKIYKSFYR